MVSETGEKPDCPSSQFPLYLSLVLLLFFGKHLPTGSEDRQGDVDVRWVGGNTLRHLEAKLETEHGSD